MIYGRLEELPFYRTTWLGASEKNLQRTLIEKTWTSSKLLFASLIIAKIILLKRQNIQGSLLVVCRKTFHNTRIWIIEQKHR